MTYLFLFILGTAFGSFFNVLIDRLPNEESIMGRSHCDHCRHKLGPFDLIPVVSYLVLRGKCEYCGKKISFVNTLVEILTGVLFVVTWIALPTVGMVHELSLQILFFQKILYLGIISCLIVVFFADAKYRIIPDSIQVVFFLLSLLLTFSLGFTSKILLDRVIASFGVMLPILFLFLVTKGRGMGFGDVKFAFSMGLLLGLRNGFIALYLAFIFGALFGLVTIMFGKNSLKSKIAFGPFLVLGLCSLLFFGDKVNLLSKQIFGF